MAPLAWLAIPLGALLIAVVWAAWAGRARGPGDPVASVAAHHRFVEALERTRREQGIAGRDDPGAVLPAGGDRTSGADAARRDERAGGRGAAGGAAGQDREGGARSVG